MGRSFAIRFGGSPVHRKLFVVALVALFCLANVTRAAYRSRVQEPRFAAEGAAHFRYTEMIAEGKSIPALDASAQWPEGLRVFRETSPLMEYLFGWTWRLIPGGKPDLAAFIRYGTAFFFSLAIVPVALLSVRIWRSLRSGAVAALVFAAALPLVARSSGFEFIRENVTFPLIFFQGYFYVMACAEGGAVLPALSGIFLFAALASWHGAQFYCVPFFAFLLARAVAGEPGLRERRASIALAVAIAAAGIVVPYLREGRFLLSLSASLAAAVLVLGFLGPRTSARAESGRATRRGADPRTAKALIAMLVIAAVITPGVVSGRHFASYSHFFDSLLYKFRYLAKPDDPRLLPFDARAFWVGPFNSPDGLHFFVFALPMLLLLAGALPALVRRAKERDLEGQFMLTFLIVSFLFFLLMQRLLPLFGFFAALAAGGCARGLFEGRSLRGIMRPAPVVAIAVIGIFILQDFAWEGRYDLWRAAARRLRVPSREQFVVYPFARDVEGNLLAWIRGNVEPRAVVMSLHYLSPQVLTYTGRATNLNDFFESPLLRKKAERLLTLLYSDEEELYRFCVEQSASYLLLSCAVGCDPTKESPLYQAGLVRLPSGCAAYRLMFEPERLSRFDLVYENEMYRLFRVGRSAGAHIGPRSPLFYERDLLWKMNGDVKRFYNSVMRVYALTARGRMRIARGAEGQGEGDCVEALRVYYFYPAWKALDDLYARRGRTEARETLGAFAYRCDPNRADVCLALAESRMELGKLEGVREILERCLGTVASAAERERAAALSAKLGSAVHTQPKL